MIKCANCKTIDKNMIFYKYMKKTYCMGCLEEYFIEELARGRYFDDFLESECEEIKT